MILEVIIYFIIYIVLLVGQFLVLAFLNFVAVMSLSEWLDKRRKQKRESKNNKEV